MDYLSGVRKEFIDLLWSHYKESTPEAAHVCKALNSAGEPVVLDHLAFIDLPGPCSGIPYLRHVFTSLGFCQAGQGYLPAKANGFIWMRQPDFEELTPLTSLPQIVLADFNLEDCSPMARRIIQNNVADCVPPVTTTEIRNLCESAAQGNFHSSQKLLWSLCRFFFEFKYQRPTVLELETLLHENELMAWCLLFGREVNHFGLSLYLSKNFQSLEHFNHFAVHKLHLRLNERGGFIKGSPSVGLEQSSTINEIMVFKLDGGVVQVPNRFVEFVWRHSLIKGSILWKDLFSDFITHHADRVVESLCQKVPGSLFRSSAT